MRSRRCPLGKCCCRGCASCLADADGKAQAVLIATGKKRGMLPYSKLLDPISAICFKARDIRLFDLLGEISNEEYLAGRGVMASWLFTGKVTCS